VDVTLLLSPWQVCKGLPATPAGSWGANYIAIPAIPAIPAIVLQLFSQRRHAWAQHRARCGSFRQIMHSQSCRILQDCV